ncbi:short-chain dehydrogenase/reductase SDR [Kipferlia bialata]|uniref:Short-chain dehydrogenase/reductase SDR n=1 Tax=Kipferlia bialata TaxID=797122 RepID=A0A9K3D6Y0_9EUKA|nr:short-chain dehydrogenase/reductase SDR [Kipferlia bialata]|eukprot:g12208.t1
MSYPELLGKVALVTGSTSGIGFAIAREYVAQGCGVIVVSRRQTKVDETVAQLVNYAINDVTPVFGCAADVANDEGIARIIDFCQSLDQEE